MTLKIIVRVFALAKPYRIYLTFSIIALFLVISVNLYTPMLARTLIDNSSWTSQSTIIAVTLVLAYLLRGVMQFVTVTLSHVSSLKMQAFIQSKVYAHLQKLSRSFYSDHQSGQLLSRITHATEQVEELISHALPDAVSNIVLVIGVTVAMSLINPVLAAITVVTIVPVLTVGLFQKRVGMAFRQMNKEDEELTSMLSENLQGIREIQLFNRQQYENERIEKKAFVVAKASIKAIGWYNFLSPGIEFFTSIGQVAVIAVGGYMTVTGAMTSGDVVAFLLYIGLFYGPVAALSNTLQTIQKAAAGAVRFFEILDQPVTIEDGSISANTLSGEIQFDDVSFSYDADNVILNKVSLLIPAGQTVVMIGTTGAGKTTFLNLIVRLFDTQQGSISIDGVNIKEYTLESLHANVSIVSQDVFLFSGTIYDNIAYSKADATSEEVYNAAMQANIHSFVFSLKNGYDTIIGEKGIKLSGGQRQRLAIARAVLCNSSILLLDEATSAVDEETECEIRKAVAEIYKEKTVLIVTHRLAAIGDGDRVITIENGMVKSDVEK